MRALARLMALLLPPLFTAACGDLSTVPTAPERAAVPSDHALTTCYGTIAGGVHCEPISNNPPECDPWMSLNWCEDDNCEMSEPGTGDPEHVGIAGCNNTGSPTPPPPGDSTPPPPPPSQPADTCNTGDPVVESDAIQTAFSTIWAESNYDPSAPQSQRREQGGWITSDGAGGMQFTPFPSDWERTPCQIKFPQYVTPPVNLVGWVHTHPYKNGDVMTECEQMKLPGGLQRPYTYRGDPSFADDELTRMLRQNGYPNLRGYVIDADKITWYTGDDTPTTVGNYPRCAY